MFSFTDPSTKKTLEIHSDYIENKYRNTYELSQRKEEQYWTSKELVATFFICASEYINSCLVNPEDFDRKTTFSSKEVSGDLINTEHLKYDPKIYLRTMLRFCWEYNLSLDSKNINHKDILLKSNKVELLNNIEESVWGERPSNIPIDFTWITNVMPFEIYKQFLKSDELRSAKNLSADIINEKKNYKKPLTMCWNQQVKVLNIWNL